MSIEEPHLYDFSVPFDNNLNINYTLEEAIEIIKKALEPLGEEYIRTIDLLLDGHIDAEIDENKHQSIIFSWSTYSFLSFREKYVDIKNLIHEIGHIVNDYLSIQKQPFVYESIDVFIGETASIVNEILLNRYLCSIAQTPEEKAFYLSKNIENYFISVFRQTMNTEFEKELYAIRQKEELTPEIINREYLKIIKKYYGIDIQYDDIVSVEWTRLGHLYRWSYYPYKYATGLLIASLVVNSLDNKTLTPQEYLEFLSSGSNQYSLELLKKINIDLTNPKVIDLGFNELQNNIEQLNQILSLKK